ALPILMTMISRAGGLNDDASSRILLFPAPRPAEHQTGPVTEVHIDENARDNTSPTLLAKNEVTKESLADVSENPIDRTHALAEQKKELPSTQLIIDLSRPDNQRYLEMSARPGDVIVVPAAGEVTVQGWVDKPGAFPITSGMTVLGSVAAAGGPLFSSSATLLREQSEGHKVEVALDLDKMKHGEQPDLPVQGGDVVVVERSVAGAVPYSLYLVVQRIGIGLPMIP